MQSLQSTLLLVCVLVIWAAIFYLIMRLVILGYRSKSWPTASGEVVVSEMEKQGPGETGIFVNKHRAIIVYEYEVNNRTYTSHVLSFGEFAFEILNRGLRSRRGAHFLVTKYPLGSQVTVYYEPGQPARATLEPGILSCNTILLVTIFGFLGLFLIAAIILV